MKIPPAARQSAFTLLELLVVIAIIGTLVAVTLPALPGLSKSANMNRAVSGIPLLLESSRAYAMARNTYVWVGFNLDTTAQQLTVGVVAGATGQGDDLDAAAYSPITNLHVYDHLSLKNISGLSGMASNGDNITDSKIGTFSQSKGASQITFTNILQYSPQGAASILPSSSSHWIQIGLQPAQGNKPNDPNVAVFQVATLTGQVQIFRP
jgi:prepilin-type N-terminal cleavage/methylation domain-containing protein